MSRPTHWRTLEELAKEPTQVSLIFEPVDFEVDFVVRESASERARRIWRISGEKEPTQ